MNVLDIAILIILGGGLIRGYSSGLVRQVAGVVGLLLAIVLGSQLMHKVGDIAVASLGISPQLGPIVGFVLIVLAVQLVFFTLTRAVEGIIGALKLSSVNRLFGAGLGAIKAALAMSLLLFALSYVELPGKPTIETSALYEPIYDFFPQAWDFVAEQFPEVKKIAEEFGKRMEQELPDAG
ncbi:MAG: CvpA family protein [Bacteroidota bacterium]